ncbi:MAG: HAMP domain-containing sensor histidine kinase [Clostridia bacterium]|nr:HAMP domain-containing sensor histidine kinase [Clostridia bacterium]
MSIRIRLILSYLAMVIVPVIFFIMATFLLAIAFRGDIIELKSLVQNRYAGYHPVTGDMKLFISLQKESILNPEQFLDRKFLKSTDQRLHSYNAALVVRKGEELVYLSPSQGNLNAEDLPPFGANSKRELEKIGKRLFAVKQHDFIFSDGSEGTIFLLQDASPVVEFAHTLSPLLLGLLLLGLVLTNGLLTYFVSRSIIRPIEYLKRAAGELKEGNLGFQVKETGKDEIGQLGQAFEEMRVKLKESIDLQLHYEENRKELISSISHDLQTPIAAIKGYVEGIQDGVANSPEKMDRYIKTIYAKANDMEKLIDELFLYSKLDLKRLPFNFEQVDTHSYFQDYIEELRFDLEKGGVELSFRQEGNISPLITVDREKLKRVLTNIVDNSLKYIDKPEKRIAITLTGTNQELTVGIRDNGPGIPPEDLPFIFDRFYRVDQSRNTATGGSGLGLAIAKRIVEEHGGTIWAESQPGEGTSIYFSLKNLNKEGVVQ